MLIPKLQAILNEGEGLKIEFKECKSALNKDVYGPINNESFSPFPKNPVIARIFKEIGLAYELGSGVRNLVKYSKFYSDLAPQLIEEDIFRTIIQLKSSNEPVNEPVKLTKDHIAIIKAIENNSAITKEELVNITGKSRSTITRQLTNLKKAGIIGRRGSDKKGYWKILGDKGK